MMIHKWSPRLGGHWKLHNSFLFCKNLKLRKSNWLANRTCMSVMQVWSTLRGHLSCIGPTTNVEWMRQHQLQNERERCLDKARVCRGLDYIVHGLQSLTLKSKGNKHMVGGCDFYQACTTSGAIICTQYEVVRLFHNGTFIYI